MSTLRRKQRDEAWKNYIADTLYYQGRNRILMIKYADMFKEKDKRSGDEIAADVISRCGLEVTG